MADTDQSANDAERSASGSEMTHLEEAQALRAEGMFDKFGKDAQESADSLLLALEDRGLDNFMSDVWSEALCVMTDLRRHLFPHYLSGTGDNETDIEMIESLLEELKEPADALLEETTEMSKMLDELMEKANQLRLRKKNGWPIQLKEYQWLIRNLDMPDRKLYRTVTLAAEFFDLAITHPLRNEHGRDRSHVLWQFDDAITSLSLTYNEISRITRVYTSQNHFIFDTVQQGTTREQRNQIMPPVRVRLRARRAVPIPPSNTSGEAPSEGSQETSVKSRERNMSFSGSVDVPESIVEHCGRHDGEDYDCEEHGCSLSGSVKAGSDTSESTIRCSTLRTGSVATASTMTMPTPNSLHLPLPSKGHDSRALWTPSPDIRSIMPFVEPAWDEAIAEPATPRASLPQSAPLREAIPWASPPSRRTRSDERDAPRAIFGSATRGQRQFPGGLQPLALTRTLQAELLKNAQMELQSPSEAREERIRAKENTKEGYGRTSKGKGRATDLGNITESQMAKSRSTPAISGQEIVTLRPRKETI